MTQFQEPDSLSQTPTYMEDNARLMQALLFATEKHRGQLRKGTTLPYILHPLEVWQILSAMHADTTVQIAGLLHDTLEDTDATPEEIQTTFGDEVAALVQHHTENKSDVWMKRKQTAIDTVRNANVSIKMLVMADKLSNLRSMARDYKELGDALWLRFNAPKEKQAWYYNGMLDALTELAEYTETADFYQELVELYKDVFVLYKISPDYERLYQANTFGEAYCLTKGSPLWQPVNYRFRNEDIPLTRKEAESLQEKWYDLFLQAVEQDLANGTYPLFSTPMQQFTISIADACLKFTAVENGVADVMTLNEDDTYSLLSQLRATYNTATPLAQILLKTFGHPEGALQFRDAYQQLQETH